MSQSPQAKAAGTIFAALLAVGVVVTASCSDRESVNAATLNTGYAYCTTAASLDRLTQAAVRHDRIAQGRLIGTVCGRSFRPGLRYSVLDGSITTVHVRVHAPSGPVDVWTYREAILSSKTRGGA